MQCYLTLQRLVATKHPAIPSVSKKMASVRPYQLVPFGNETTVIFGNAEPWDTLAQHLHS